MKLKSKLFACICAVSLCLMLAVPTVALAAPGGSSGSSKSANSSSSRGADNSTLYVPDASSLSTKYVLDHAGVLSSSDLKQYESQAKAMSEASGCNVYTLFVDNIGSSSARQYAIAYYRANNLGQGSDKNGILFLIAVKSRDYVTITQGQGSQGGIYLFTDYRIEQMETNIVAKLKNNKWSDACQVYLNDCQTTFDFATKNGTPLDKNNDPATFWNRLLIKLGGAALLALVITAFVLVKWRNEMKTARQKNEASNYFVSDSLNLTHEVDRYVTTTRTRVRVEPKGGGGGGGSSISGGFGGSGGGKF